ncbi:MAG: hypothetical protein NTW86_22120 [Candidatus Sumerlaeota bacterium]|nr:hypothetical protein [Candidatus Sumerlaeota bacterium]
MNASKWIWGGVAVGALALMAAAIATPLVGRSLVDVGVDLASAPPVAPALRWGDRPDQAAAMERLPGEFSPRLSFFTLTATGGKNPASQGREVWIKGLPQSGWSKRTPFECWRKVGDSPVAVWFPATAEWACDWAASPTLTLGRHAWSGKAVLATPTGTQTLDLYDAKGSLLKISIPVWRPVRYHAFVPRAALGRLRLAFEGAAPPKIPRVYVGALEPRILSSGQGPDPLVWGWKVAGWLPEADPGGIPLPASSPLEEGGAATFACLFGIFAALFAAAGLAAALAARLICRLWREPLPAGTLPPGRRGVFLAFLAAAAAVWLFYLACLWPAAMTNDSVNQWAQAHTLRLREDYPPIHTLAIYALTRVWDSPAVAALAQIALLALALARAFQLLLRAGAPRTLTVVAFLCAVLSPRTGEWSVILTKDVPYAALLLLLTTDLALLLLDEGKRKSRGRWMGVGVWLGLIVLLRPNGLAVWLGVAAALLVAFRPAFRRVLLALAVSGVLTVATVFDLYAWMNIQNDPKGPWPGAAIAHTLAALVSQDAPLTQEECEFLSRVHSFENRWEYTPMSLTPLLASPAYDGNFVRSHLWDCWRTETSLIARYPLLYARHCWAVAANLSPAMKVENDPAILTAHPGLSGNAGGVKSTPLLPRAGETLRSILRLTTRPAWSWLFWRPRLDLALILAAAGILYARRRDARLWIVYLPALLSVAGLLLVGPPQELRDQFALSFPAGFLIVFAFLPPAPRLSADGKALAGSRIPGLLIGWFRLGSRRLSGLTESAWNGMVRAVASPWGRRLLIYGGALLLSAAGARFAARQVGESRICVELDLPNEPSEPPILSWGEDGGDQATMERIAPPAAQEGERMVDSHSAPVGGMKTSVSPARPVRYRAFVPRRALAELRLSYPGMRAAAIPRFYVGALIPTTFTTNRESDLRARGRAVLRWKPVFSRRGIELPPLSAVEQGGAATFAAVFALFAVVLALGAAVIARRINDKKEIGR